MRERGVRSEGGADDEASSARHLDGPNVVDLERRLEDSAGLAEQNRRVDAGERCLTELGDGILLPVPRLDLGAQTGQFRRCRLRVRGATDQMKRLFLFGHVSLKVTAFYDTYFRRILCACFRQLFTRTEHWALGTG